MSCGPVVCSIILVHSRGVLCYLIIVMQQRSVGILISKFGHKKLHLVDQGLNINVK